jgi:hypothetical protein
MVVGSGVGMGVMSWGRSGPNGGYGGLSWD